MKITIDAAPIDQYPFWMVPPGGGRGSEGKRTIEKTFLEILHGAFFSASLGVDALIVTSDLQGKVIEDDREFLLGEKLPDHLKLLLQLEFPQIRPDNIGVLLCGDFFAMLEKRGGLGDVKPVWRQFKSHFKWVAGVAGNHDDFGTRSVFEAFKREEGMYYLHKGIRKIDKAEMGGISGIIGETGMPNRLEEADFLKTLKQLAVQQLEFILLHEGPDFPAAALDGNPKIREVLEQSPANTIFCGHRHWDQALVNLENGTQVLNVDKRVAILTKTL